MTARHWIGTSWKMTKTLSEALRFSDVLARTKPVPAIQRFVIPPFTAVREVKARLAGTDLKVGAQNMHWAEAGAWTGEISPGMLTDCGLDMVELGHSERRANFGETDATVGWKVATAVRHGLIPLICVGENSAARDAGQADAVLARQVRAALADVERNQRLPELLFAYEPIWAIGTSGVPATADYAAARQAMIKSVAAEMLGAPPRCLYGGSVSTTNCAGLIAEHDIDGLFIGRAAWNIEGYLDILSRCATVIGQVKEGERS